MARPPQDVSVSSPMKPRVQRAPLPAPSARCATVRDGAVGMTHEQLVEKLRAIDGLIDVGRDPPNFLFRSRPFLHFHTNEEGTYADVRFGTGDFERVRASTSEEREELLARVYEHVDHLQRSRKSKRSDRRERR